MRKKNKVMDKHVQSVETKSLTFAYKQIGQPPKKAFMEIIKVMQATNNRLCQHPMRA